MGKLRIRMTEEQTDRLLECFVAGTPARPAADTAGVNRNSARMYYHRLRETIALRLVDIDRWRLDPGAGRASVPHSAAAALLDRSVPLSPSPLEAARILALVAMAEREGRVYVVAIGEHDPVCHVEDPHEPPGPPFDALVCTDEVPAAPDAATDEVRQGRLRLRVDPELAADPLRRRTLRTFWQHTGNLLRRFNGVPRQHLFLYLKECEWRFNEGADESRLVTLRSWFLQRDRRHRDVQALAS